MGGEYGNSPAVWGTFGTPAAGNIPTGRDDAVTWKDNSGNFWLFGGTGEDLWKFNPLTNQWAWMGGGDAITAATGVYGTLGTPAPGNMPGSRFGGSSWTDGSGNFWLFGGYGFPANLNDLWEYRQSITNLPSAPQPTFSLASGTYTAAQTVTISDAMAGATIYYTTNGTTPTASSTVYGGPITVSSSLTLEAIATATDYAASAVATASYTFPPPGPAQTTATLGSSLNPSGFAQPVTFTATVASQSAGTPTGTVTFSNGNSPLGTAPVTSGSAVFTLAALPQGTDLITATYSGDPNFAGSKSAALSQVVNAGATAAGQWTWMGGSNAINQPGVYGALGTPAAGNTPGSRDGAVTWTDTAGHLWLFGGQLYDPGNTGCDILNDLWEFNPALNEWTWMGGSSAIGNTCVTAQQNSNFCGQPGVYGSLGKPAAANIPGGRLSANSWIDSSGHFWLFGGDGFDAAGNFGYLNDLWEFNPSTNQWTWISGSNTLADGGYYVGQAGVYGTLGVYGAENNPGGRYAATSWIDRSGHLWLFGGYRYDGNGNSGFLNDLWEFSPSTGEWAWMGGSNTFSSLTNVTAVYGTLGTAAAANIPGGRYCTTSWTDESGHVWLFGGQGYDVTGTFGDLNDLWEFNTSTNEWTWMGGSSKVGSNGSLPGVYGTLGTAAPGNTPGARWKALSWTDSGGNLWLFGGQGVDTNNNNLFFNDLWLFNPLTNQWAWMSGSSLTNCSSGYYSSCGQTGVYGAAGIPSAGNAPGSRFSATGWADSSGRLWLFGGSGSITTNAVYFNDLWKYQPAITSLSPTATPTFSVPTGTYTSAQTVTITDQTPGAIIYYTSNGTPPTTSSTQYTGPITVSTTETIQAIALASGYGGSIAASSTYTFNPDFSVTASPASITVNPGQSANATISVAPLGGFASTVSFSCSGLPAGTSCNISPATVTPSGATVSTTLTVTATANASNQLPAPIGYAPVAALVLALGLVRRKHRRLYSVWIGVAATLSLFCLTACGGGNSNSNSQSTPPPESGLVTVTAISGSLSHAASLTVYVN